MTNIINRPVAFTGTDEERTANRATHRFTVDFDGEVRCLECEHKLWHVGADYPCGVEPERETVDRETKVCAYCGSDMDGRWCGQDCTGDRAEHYGTWEDE